MPVTRSSHEQRNVDATQASTVREARNELLGQVHAGQASIGAVLQRAASDPMVAKTKVSQLVQALPGYGPSKAVGVLSTAGIAVGRRVEELEPSQYQALVDALATS